MDGSWHAYATLHYGRFRTAVAHFLPSGVESWNGAAIHQGKLDRILAGQETRTAYDANLVTADDGRLYLIYSASAAPHHDVHILAQPMLGPGAVDPASPPRPILSPQGYRSEDRNPGYIQLVEGANITRVGGRSVLLYSAGDFAQNNYKLGLAYSDCVIPPPGEFYRKALLPGCEEVCYLLQSRAPGVAELLRSYRERSRARQHHRDRWPPRWGSGWARDQASPRVGTRAGRKPGCRLESLPHQGSQFIGDYRRPPARGSSIG